MDLEEESSVADRVRRARRGILEDWERSVKRLTVGRGLSRPWLLDHMPALLDRIAAVCDELAAGGRSSIVGTTAADYALDRLARGFDVAEVVKELAMFRASVFSHLERAPGDVNFSDLLPLNGAIDQALSEAVDHYVEMQADSIRSLERVATAAITTSDLGELLRRLLEILRAAANVIDVAAISLWEAGHLRETTEEHAAAMDAVIESIPEAIVIRTHHGEVRANRAAIEIAGSASADAHLSGPDQALDVQTHPRDPDTGAPLPPEEVPLTKALHGETVSRELLIGGCDEGASLVVRTSAAPIRTHGEVIGAVSVSADITVSKRSADAERVRLAHLKARLDHAPAAVFIRDLEGRYILANRSYARLFGREDVEMAGLLLREGHPKASIGQIEAAEARDRSLVERNRPIQHEEACTAEGERRVFLFYDFPLRNLTGDIYAVCGIGTEITDRKRIEGARERVIGILGHDLRTPMSAILLAATMLEAPEVTEETRTRIARRIGVSGQRMSRMIADLLDFTRGHLGGGFPIAPTATCLLAVCRDAVEEMQTSDAEVRFEVHERGDVRGVWDRDRLSQVVSNLLSNAATHRAPKTPVRIDISGHPEEVRLEITNVVTKRVPDTQLELLFDPFRKADDTHGACRRGLGLGLYIAREIVRAHGGSIEAKSTATPTFSIIVSLPRRSRPSAGSPRPAA